MNTCLLFEIIVYLVLDIIGGRVVLKVRGYFSPLGAIFLECPLTFYRAMHFSAKRGMVLRS